MKGRVVSGAMAAAAAVALVLAGAAPAAAKRQVKKPDAAKMSCGGKNSCPTKVEKAAEPPTESDSKAGAAKSGETK